MSKLYTPTLQHIFYLYKILLYTIHKKKSSKTIYETKKFALQRKVTTSKGTSTEVSFYISSLISTAENFLEIVRKHWRIESMHWQLDVVFNEDGCRVISENGQKSLNMFRKTL